VWTPPADLLPTPIDACPNCGEEVAITRIDLTANAGWLNCRACGLRWGGTIERERGRAAAG
jgi:transcription elongation factor Elf1